MFSFARIFVSPFVDSFVCSFVCLSFRTPVIVKTSLPHDILARTDLPNTGRVPYVRDVQSYLLAYFAFFLFVPLLFRKKTKVAPGVIQISSKSRLSSWSSPDIKLRSKSLIGRNSSVSSFTSLRGSELGGLPRSFSDSCLAKRRLEDDVDEFKNPSSSAPQSCSGSSGSDDEDEGSGETEDMDHYDPSVSSTSWIVSIYIFSLSISINR